ncbi:MAG: GNVR domain-containing protein [Saprospiraceae bacterium]
MQDYQASVEKEFTLRDHILRAKDYFHEVLRYWYIPALLALLVAVYKFYQYTQYVPIYPAKITFMVDEDEGGGNAGLAGMLGQFGLGGVRPARYNLDKILELSKSRRVVQQTFFAKVSVDDKEDFLINHIIRLYDVNVPQDDKMREQPYLFQHDSIAGFSIYENEVLLTVYNLIIGSPKHPENALLNADYNENTNIMSMTASTIDEELSFELAEHAFESLSNYYISKAIEKSLKTYRIVSTKKDSVLGALRSAEYSLANFRDTHRGMMMRVDNVSELRLQRDVTALSTMYAEILKNTEVADFSLRNKTPFIQVIDQPILPIRPVTLSLWRQLAIGLVIGGLIGVLLVSVRKLIRVLMAPRITIVTTER